MMKKIITLEPSRPGSNLWFDKDFSVFKAARIFPIFMWFMLGLIYTSLIVKCEYISKKRVNILSSYSRGLKGNELSTLFRQIMIGSTSALSYNVWKK